MVVSKISKKSFAFSGFSSVSISCTNLRSQNPTGSRKSKGRQSSNHAFREFRLWHQKANSGERLWVWWGPYSLEALSNLFGSRKALPILRSASGTEIGLGRMSCGVDCEIAQSCRPILYMLYIDGAILSTYIIYVMYRWRNPVDRPKWDRSERDGGWPSRWGEEGWLARHSTIEQTGSPHRLDM